MSEKVVFIDYDKYVTSLLIIIKRHLLLGKKAMINLESILKSRDINLTKVYIVKAMVFQ